MKKFTRLLAVGMPLLLATVATPLHSYAQPNKKLTAQQAKSAKKHPLGFQTQQEAEDTNGLDEQDPKLTCSITAPTPEPGDLTSLAKISAKDAKAKALSGQPAGTTVTRTELDNENDCLVYSVELSNNLEVKVDAGNGAVLLIEPADSDDIETGSSDGETQDDGSSDGETHERQLQSR